MLHSLHQVQQCMLPETYKNSLRPDQIIDMVDGFAASKYCEIKYKYIFKKKLRPPPNLLTGKNIFKNLETQELFEVQKRQATFMKA